MIGKIVPFALPAIVSFVLSLWYQFRVFDTRAVFIFDSGHYLLTTAELLAVIRATLSGNLQAAHSLVQSPDFVSNIMMDGPVLVLLGALSFLLSSQPPVATSWPVIVVLLSILNAVSAGVVALLSQRLVKNRGLAVCIGVLFAISPTTITSSGRYLTEPVATCILLLLCLVCSNVVRAHEEKLRLSFVAGLLTAVGFLLKPVLLPVWVTLSGVSLMIRIRKRQDYRRALLLLFAGSSLVICLWLGFTRIATGQFHAMPQRLLGSNLAQGHDFETDGRGSIGPRRGASSLSPEAEPYQILRNAWCQHPKATISLYVRKLPRILGYVWNDFKQVTLGLGIEQQNFLQGVILSFAMIGVVWNVFAVAGLAVDEKADRLYLLLVLPAVLLIHAILYLPFESAVRYGAPLYPFLLLSASLALDKLAGFGYLHRALMLLIVLLEVIIIKSSPSSLLGSEQGLSASLLASAALRTFSLLLCFAFALWLATSDREFLNMEKAKIRWCRCLLGLVFFCFILVPVDVSCLHKINQRESRLELAPNDQIVREIALPKNLGSGLESNYFIYIDCDERYRDAVFTVNGKTLDAPLISANKLDTSCYFIFNILRMYASVFDKSVDELRQWRVLELPSELVKAGGLNQVAVRAGARGLTVFADKYDADEQAFQLPNRAIFSASRICSEGMELDGRVLERGPTSVYSPAAQLVTGGSQSVISMRQPRFFILSAGPEQTNAPKEFELQSLYQRDLPLSLFDPVLLAAGAGTALRIDRYTLQLARSTSASVALPERFNSLRQLDISITGKLLNVGRADKVGILASLSSSNADSSLILPATPPFFVCGKRWTEFTIKDRVCVPEPSQHSLTLTLSLFPGRWEQMSQYGVDRNVGSFLVKDLKLFVSEPQRVDLAKRTIILK